MKKIKISFDFDSTLALSRIQELLSCYDRDKVELFVVTARDGELKSYHNRDLLYVIQLMNIPEDNVFFTNGSYKAQTLNMIKADYHYDDMPDEIATIQAECPWTFGFLVSTNIWADIEYMQCIPTTGNIQYEHENFE